MVSALAMIDDNRDCSITHDHDEFPIYNSLTPGNIRDLIEEKVSAIRIANYIPSETAQKMIDFILAQTSLDAYTHEVYADGVPEQKYYGVYRIGFPFNTTYGRPNGSPERETYYQAALPGLRRLRDLCAPNLTPIDRLRLDLDEIWTDGASIAAFEGQKMFAGIARIMPPDDSHILEEKPHVDCLPATVCMLDQQLSANIYLKMPPIGGTLETWNVPTLSYADIERLPDGTIARSDLPKPVVIHPQECELVLINTRKPHAVSRFSGGIRISIQAFIGYQPGKPLRLWC